MAFIKRTPVIDADKPVSSQLRVLTLSEDSPYETLHSFISNAVAPFFKSYIRESGKADRYTPSLFLWFECRGSLPVHVATWKVMPSSGAGRVRLPEEARAPAVPGRTIPSPGCPELAVLLLCRDGDKMAPSVEKKIAELEMGLLHLQQNIEIPEISLPIHPILTNVAKQCYERGEKPKVTDFGEKVEDPTFLNQLQSGVNRWIREIQKVRAQ